MGGNSPEAEAAQKQLEGLRESNSLQNTLSQRSIDAAMAQLKTNLAAQQGMQTTQIGATKELNAENIQAEMDRLQKEEGFTGTQADLQRQATANLQSQQLGAQKELNQSNIQAEMDRLVKQEGFQGTQADLERQAAANLQSKSQAFTQEQTASARQYAGEQQAKGENVANAGEQSLNSLTGSALPELEQMKKDYAANALKGQEAARNQMATTIRQQGARGGQAATLLDRGIGEANTGMQNDLNTMSYNEAMARRKAATDYATSKALTGTNRALTPTTVQ